MGWFGRDRNPDTEVHYVGSCCLCGAEVSKHRDTVCAYCSEYRLTAAGRDVAVEERADNRRWGRR